MEKKRIYVADDYREVINEAWSLMEEMLAKYYFDGCLESMADVDVEDFKNLQKGIQLSIKLRDVALKMADQMDQQTEMIYLCLSETRQLSRQNIDLLESMERLEKKLSKKND